VLGGKLKIDILKNIGG